MGIIKDEVKHAHLTQYPHEEYLISSLTNDFNINWARRRKAFGCELSAYILGPENSIIESFGLDREVLMVIVEYDGLQARVMQAINQFFGDHPFNGRTDSTVFVMIVRSNKERDWVESYVTENPESRIPVIFTYDDIESARHDAWKIRNILSRYLYFRDLFHYTLPLDNDRFFFGREQQVNDLTDSIRKSDNVGLFGLRKTGKTSILFKLTRLARRTKDLEVIYYDCKFPGIRSSHWSDFLDRIVRDISCISKNIKEPDSSKGHASDRFLEILKQVPKRMSICIVFDEIEFISPLNDRDPHWSKEFVDLWQTLWSAQSIHRKLSFIVAGVSPTIVERDRIDNVHNPVFGIVRPIFLTGFRRDEVTQMLRSFGKRMGLRFSDDAKDYLLDRYGGHPLLTRMACSFVHQKLMLEGYERPVTISFTWLEETQKERDADIRFYCNHVVSELKDFYPEEYEMLEMLATRNYVDFREFAQDPEFTRHLSAYGLVNVNESERPKFSIPVIGDYLADVVAKREGRPLAKYTVPENQKGHWVSRRATNILADVRELDRACQKQGGTPLYDGHGIAEPERVVNISHASHRESFTIFINVVNRAFVEQIESIAKKRADKRYFWETLPNAYPTLYEALHRVKVYRNQELHLELNDITDKNLREFLKQDLDGRTPEKIEDGWFTLQQVILDNILLAIQVELSRVT